MQAFLGRFLGDTSGGSIIDYTLIGAGISLVIVALMLVIGNDVNQPFQAIAAALGVGGIGSR
jgi:Flp pilus assembly pilin Flp